MHQSFFEPRHCITISWIPGGTPLNRNVSLGVDTMGADASSSSKSSHDSTSPGVDTGSGCAESKRRKGQHIGTTAPNSTANQYNTSMYGILAYIWLLILMVNPGKKIPYTDGMGNLRHVLHVNEKLSCFSLLCYDR